MTSYFRTPFSDIRNQERVRFQDPFVKRIYNQFDVSQLENFACAPYYKLDNFSVKQICVTIQKNKQNITIVSATETCSKHLVIVGMDIRSLAQIKRISDENASLLGPCNSKTNQVKSTTTTDILSNIKWNSLKNYLLGGRKLVPTNENDDVYNNNADSYSDDDVYNNNAGSYSDDDDFDISDKYDEFTTDDTAAMLDSVIDEHIQCVRELFPNSTLGFIVQSSDESFIQTVETVSKKYHNRVFFNKVHDNNYDMRLPFTNALMIAAMHHIEITLKESRLHFTNPESFVSYKFRNVEDALMFLVNQMRTYQCFEKKILVGGRYEILKDYKTAHNAELTAFNTLLVTSHWIRSIFPQTLNKIPPLC